MSGRGLLLVSLQFLLAAVAFGGAFDSKEVLKLTSRNFEEQVCFRECTYKCLRVLRTFQLQVHVPPIKAMQHWPFLVIDGCRGVAGLRS